MSNGRYEKRVFTHSAVGSEANGNTAEFSVRFLGFTNKNILYEVN